MPPAVNPGDVYRLFPALPPELRAAVAAYVRGGDNPLTEADFDVYTRALTPFTRAVLRQAMSIPFGRTVTYTQLAQAMGVPRSVRAVAAALGRNPLPVLIPCHRVTAVNGLGGYAFGIDTKKALLAFEQTKTDAPAFTSRGIRKILKS